MGTTPDERDEAHGAELGMDAPPPLEHLLESERSARQRISTILESITDAFFALDDDWRFTYVNREAERLLEVPRHRLLHRSLWEAFPEAVGSVFERQYRRAAETGETVRFESLYPPLERWFSVAAYPSDPGVAVYFRDVTDQRRLHTAARTLRSVVDSLPDIVDVRDAAGARIYGNHEDGMFRGGVPRDLSEEELRKAHPAWAAAKVAREGIPAALDHGSWMGETAILTPAGEERPVSQMIVAGRDERGEVVHISTVLRDISDIRRREAEREESEARYRSLVEQSLAGIYILGPDSFEYVNARFAEIFGYSRADFVEGRIGVSELVHPDDLALVREMVRQRRDGERESAAYGFRAVRRDGRVRFVEVHGVRIDRPGGSAIMGVLLDNTSREETAARLRESEAKYRQLFEASPIGVVHATGDGRFLLANRAFQRMVGYDEGELRQLRWADISHPEDTPENFALARRLNDGAIDSYTLEKRYVHKDGDPVWARVSVAAVRDGAGRVEHVVGLAEDITERRRADDALRRRDAILEAVSLAGTEFLRSPDWLDVADPVLRRLGEAAGVSRVYVVRVLADDGESDRARLEREWVAEGVRPVIDDPEMAELSLRGIGHGRWLDTFREGKAIVGAVGDLPAEERPILEHQAIRAIAAVPVRVGDRLWGMLGFDDCVAERAWSSAEVDALRAAAGALGAAVQRQATEAALAESEEALRQSQKMEAVGQLAGGVAHDFNNMITAIQGFSQLLADEIVENGAGREYLDEVMRAADRSAALTRQLLAFSRKQVLRPEVLDLNHTITELQTMLRRMLGEDIEVVVRTAPGLFPVEADPGQISQILMNLCVNARDAMPEGGTLEIAVANDRVGAEGLQTAAGLLAEGEYARLSVTDSGVGMTPAVAERVFEPFFTTKEVGKGTGLGLATVFGIVNQSGGGIDVASEPEVGTRFDIFLPRSDREPDVVEPGPADPGVGGSPDRGTVLVVEDEAAVRSLAKKVLERSGYTVLSASTGREGLAIARACREPIELLLTDVIMPEMGGPELVERLRAYRPGIRVCFMSGYAADDVFRRGPVCQESGFLEKPFLPAELLKRVEEILSRNG